MYPDDPEDPEFFPFKQDPNTTSASEGMIRFELKVEQEVDPAVDFWIRAEEAGGEVLWWPF